MFGARDSFQVGSSLYADGVQPELQFPLYQIHREGVKVCSIWLLRYTGTQTVRRPLSSSRPVQLTQTPITLIIASMMAIA